VIRPPALRLGDTVGIAAPSSDTGAHVPRRFSRGAAELERRGFRVRLGEYARVSKPSIESRVADLHALFADDEVRAVVCTIGGYDSHQLLEELDFELIRANPKVFSGYSDITALTTAIHARTGLVTFMGPMLLTDWAEFGGLPEYTWAEWEGAVMRAEARGAIGVAPAWTVEMTPWDKADDRPRKWSPNEGPRGLRGGAAEGMLAPGNLSTLLLLAGTPWAAMLDGRILALEAAEEEGGWWIERSLHHLRHLGVWDRAAGLAFGRLNPASELAPADLERIVLAATRGTEFPIVVDLDFGHTEPHCTLPWGVGARLDGAEASLALIEPAVS
jgi:muramoyltetrapeptide carboxypeptidase LdcA involved in peptidoglycan recycling